MRVSTGLRNYVGVGLYPAAPEVTGSALSKMVYGQPALRYRTRRMCCWLPMKAYFLGACYIHIVRTFNLTIQLKPARLLTS